MRLLYRYRETISDGPGLRYSLYLAGCRHNCFACHNKESQNPEEGIELTDLILKDIIREINDNPLLDGISLSGGDPFFNPKELYFLVKELKEGTSLPILCYTGYTFEELLEIPDAVRSLFYIDILIDGRFEYSLRDPNLSFRGSSNQRILNIREEKYQLIVRKHLPLFENNPPLYVGVEGDD